MSATFDGTDGGSGWADGDTLPPSDAFVVAADARGGRVLWAVNFGGCYDDKALSVAVRSNGDVLVGGYFASNAFVGYSFEGQLPSRLSPSPAGGLYNDHHLLTLDGATGALRRVASAGLNFGLSTISLRQLAFVPGGGARLIGVGALSNNLCADGQAVESYGACSGFFEQRLSIAGAGADDGFIMSIDAANAGVGVRVAGVAAAPAAPRNTPIYCASMLSSAVAPASAAHGPTAHGGIDVTLAGLGLLLGFLVLLLARWCWHRRDTPSTVGGFGQLASPFGALGYGESSDTMPLGAPLGSLHPISLPPSTTGSHRWASAVERMCGSSRWKNQRKLATREAPLLNLQQLRALRPDGSSVALDHSWGSLNIHDHRALGSGGFSTVWWVAPSNCVAPPIAPPVKPPLANLPRALGSKNVQSTFRARVPVCLPSSTASRPPPPDLRYGERYGQGLAVKVFHSVGTGGTDAFWREMEILSMLRNPCICSMFGATVYDGKAAIILELAERGSLFDFLHGAAPRQSASSSNEDLSSTSSAIFPDGAADAHGNSIVTTKIGGNNFLPMLVTPEGDGPGELRPEAPLPQQPQTTTTPDAPTRDGPALLAARRGEDLARVGLSADELLRRLSSQVAEGLAFLHNSKIMHRDVKTSNVLLTADLHAKLSDFGVSKITNAGASSRLAAHTQPPPGGEPAHRFEASQSQTLAGTMRYMAPEVASGLRYSNKCDVYAFGIVLWETLNVRKPMANVNALTAVCSVVRGERPPLDGIGLGLEPFRQIIADCWAQEAHQRPSMSDVVERVHALSATAQGTVPALVELTPLSSSSASSRARRAGSRRAFRDHFGLRDGAGAPAPPAE